MPPRWSRRSTPPASTRRSRCEKRLPLSRHQRTSSPGRERRRPGAVDHHVPLKDGSNRPSGLGPGPLLRALLGLATKVPRWAVRTSAGGSSMGKRLATILMIVSPFVLLPVAAAYVQWGAVGLPALPHGPALTPET